MSCRLCGMPEHTGEHLLMRLGEAGDIIFTCRFTISPEWKGRYFVTVPTQPKRVFFSPIPDEQ